MADKDEERERKRIEQEPYREKRGWPKNEPCSGCGMSTGHSPNCPNR